MATTSDANKPVSKLTATMIKALMGERMATLVMAKAVDVFNVKLLNHAMKRAPKPRPTIPEKSPW